MALPVPKAIAKPTAQNNSAAIARLTRILATTLPTFFIREKPTSSIANPACMNSTSTAATTTHMVSIASERSLTVGPSCASARPGRASTSIRTVVVNKPSLRKSFLQSSSGYVLYEHSVGAAPQGVFSRLYKDRRFARRLEQAARQLVGKLARYVAALRPSKHRQERRLTSVPRERAEQQKKEPNG